MYGGEPRAGNFQTSKQLAGEAADGQRYVGFGLPNFDLFLFYEAGSWREIGRGFTSNSLVNAWAVTASTGDFGGDGFGRLGLAERERAANATRLEGSFKVRHTNSIRPRLDVNLRDAKGGVALQGTFAEHSDWSFRPEDIVLVPMVIFGWWPVPEAPI